MKTNTYVTAFKFEEAAATAELFSICEILMYLVKEKIIKCFNVISENHIQSIAWLMKKINKKKKLKIILKKN